MAGDLSSRTRSMPVSAYRHLEHEAKQVIPQAFQALITKSKTWLVEVACSPESRLSAEVQRQAGYESVAVRCSHWNGCDLSSHEGVKQINQLLETLRPEHCWISPECGPYSPLQAINQRSEAQAATLETKRRAALKQYVGASIVFQYCMQRGIHCTWEWAQRCQGWRLPLMQNIMKRYVPYTCVTQGCQVNLRDPKTHTLMHKGWKMMTSHERLSEVLQLPCRCPHGFRHAKCEGGNAGLTAYYTKEFVRRVCGAIFQELDTQRVTRELSGHSHLLKGFGEGPVCICKDVKVHESVTPCGACMRHTPEPQLSRERSRKVQFCESYMSSPDVGGLVDDRHSSNCPQNAPEASKTRTDDHTADHDGNEATRESTKETACTARQLVGETQETEIKRKLHLLHCATGHGSVQHMVSALRRRGASEQILRLAQEFRCSTCDERRK